MQTLARLPVFYALKGKRVLLAGGSPPAAWKADLLRAAGARIDLYIDDMCDELRDIAVAAGGQISVHARRWQVGDFAGAAMAIGDCASDEEAGAFAAAARAAGVPVNVIDKPDFCDFAFGAIVNRSPLVVGISTDGAAPVFGQAIRAKIEGMLPAGFAAWAQAAKEWREQLKPLALSFNARSRFWQLFTARAAECANDTPGESDFAELLKLLGSENAARATGSVTLVGAGPGDPELLTLRAVRALQSADVILYDDLVSPDILDFARREAKRMMVGKTGFGPSCKQDDINALMVGLARGGKRVVRLKGGDPMIFGRAGEEIAACRAAGIGVEIVPGITAAQGAASQLGISLTDRARVRRVQYVTGAGKLGALPDDLDWKSLADPSVTTAIYMPTRTLAAFVEAACDAGLDRATPSVAVCSATRREQQIVGAPIGELAAALAAAALSGPVLVMVGQVLDGHMQRAEVMPAQAQRALS